MTEVKEEAFEIRFKSGISRNSITAILYSLFVFTPALQYMELVTGRSDVSVAWFTLILWVEVLRLTGGYLSKQEALLIFLLAGAYSGPLDLIYRAWFVHSDIAAKFGLTELIPTWWAPSVYSGAYESRNLFHLGFMPSYILRFITIPVSILMSLSLGVFAKEIFIEVEDLPFPMQEISGRAVLTLTEADERRTNRLFIFIFMGFWYGFVVYALPNILTAWTGRPVSIIPIPWFDMTFQGERAGLSGAILGIATTLSPYALAFILPSKTLLSMVVGALAISLFGNWIWVRNSYQPVWWYTGMKIDMILQRSTMYVWAAPLMGFSIAVGLMPLARNPKVVPRAIKSMILFEKGTAREGKTEPFNFYTYFLVPYAATTIAGILYFAILSPNFFTGYFYFIVPFVIFLPLIFTLIEGRMIGETGVEVVEQGRITNAFYLATGYPGVDMWYVPNMWNTVGTSWLRHFKLFQLCDLSFKSYLTLYILLIPLGWAAAFLFAQIFWNLAPIPSGTYTGAAIFWPLSAVNQAVIIRGPQLGLFKIEWLLIGVVVGVALDLVSARVGVISAIGVAAGASSSTPFALAWLLGYIIAMVVRKVFGEVWFQENRRLIAAGLIVGQSIAIATSVGLALIISALWTRPF